MKSLFQKSALLGLILGALSCSNQNSLVDIEGSGASFPYPYYTSCFDEYGKQSNTIVSYGAVGSGTGLRNLSDKVVDFAGTDAYLSDEDLKQWPPVVHIPTCMGAIVLAYNIPTVNNLILDGDVIANIFMGKITSWNDPAIQTLNPDIILPDTKIYPVYRSDGSGSTSNFTNYLSLVSPEWKDKIGAGKNVNFSTGIAAKGNEGIAQIVNSTEGSIGYIGSEYAFAQSLDFARLINARGQVVSANLESISAAGNGEMPDDTRVLLMNSDADGAYPIACLTWLVTYKEQKYGNRTIEQAQSVVKLMEYMLSEEAQSIASEVYYAPLPKVAIEKSLKNLKEITYDGKAIID